MEKENLKLPPQSIEAEQSLLGSLLIDKEAIIKVADLISPEDFYRDAHRIIYETILEISARGEPIDILSVANRLEEKGKIEAVGGRSYLVWLTNSVPSATHIISYAKIVQRKSTLRKLIKISQETIEEAYQEEKETEKILDQAEAKLFATSQRFLKQGFVPIKDCLAPAFERIEALSKGEGRLRGISTGFIDLDNVLAGLQKANLIVLAARPSLGKSAFALDIARHVAIKEKVPVGIFSLEMSKEQIVDRLISAEANVNLWKLRTGYLSQENESDFEKISEAIDKLSRAPIFIDDSPLLNVMEIRSKARKLQFEHNLGLLIIDYLQLMEGVVSRESRVQEVSEISRALKAIARELNIPVLALSQLSRATEQRTPAIPKLADLRESGSIEQDSDIVLFIYRKFMDKSIRFCPEEERHLAEIHVAKHRHGPSGVVINLFFDEQTASFKNLEKRYEEVSLEIDEELTLPNP